MLASRKMSELCRKRVWWSPVLGLESNPEWVLRHSGLPATLPGAVALPGLSFLESVRQPYWKAGQSC